jgi:hypothetical protein
MPSGAEIESFNPNSSENRPETPTEPSKPESSPHLPKKRDIYLASELTHEKPKNEIATWFKQIKNAPSDKARQDLVRDMKKSLYKDCVIKPEDIPQSYWDRLGNIAIREGRKRDLQIVHGVSIYKEEIQNQDGTRAIKSKFTFPKKLKEEKINLVISNQEQSLNAWIDYLTSDEAIHHMWAKVWILEGVKKIAFHIE